MNGRRVLERLVPVKNVERRRQLVLAARAVRRLRRRTFEAAGSARFSRPEISGLLQHLDFDGGFFVEAGANDGHRQSNTYYLERFRGWSGVLIEPIPELYERCLRERPRSRCFNCALVDAPGADPITLRYDDLGSHVLEAHESNAEASTTCWGWAPAYDVTVPSRTLSEVLDEARPARVDFLSLDVEGYEEVVLTGLDLDVYRPTYILIEAFDPTERMRRLEPIFDGRYELLARPTEKDLLFSRRVSPACAPRHRRS